MTHKLSPKDLPALDLDALDEVSGGWSLGGYASVGGGLLGGRTYTLDTHGNLYRSDSVGAQAGAGVGVGGFYSQGTPQDFFEGFSLNGSATTPGARLGFEGATNPSGSSFGLTAGVGAPGSLTGSWGEQVGGIGDVGHVLGTVGNGMASAAGSILSNPTAWTVDAAGAIVPNYDAMQQQQEQQSPGASEPHAGIDVNALQANAPHDLPDTTPRDLYGMDNLPTGNESPTSYDSPTNDLTAPNQDAGLETSQPSDYGDASSDVG